MPSWTSEADCIGRGASILRIGQLVKIGSILNKDKNSHNVGIIINCIYDLGWNSDSWYVLVDGRVIKVEGMMIWPIEE